MEYKEHKSEPFWWGMFSAGGVVAAMLIPMHLLVNGLAKPLGLAGSGVGSYETMRELIAHPLAKIYFFVLIVMPLYHAAHRIRFTLHEFGIRRFIVPLPYLCYGGALLATALAAYIFFFLL